MSATTAPAATDISALGTIPERALLIKPPVHDTRFPWSHWRQPTLLLRLATLLKQCGTDTKLLDATHWSLTKRLRRRRVDVLDLDGISVNKWRFGTPASALAAQLRALATADWRPDAIYVECFTTFWWEGASEVIALARRRFPQAQVVLLGPYADLAPDHALTHGGADSVMRNALATLGSYRPDLTLYPRPPNFYYVSLGSGTRSAEDILEEIADAAAKRIHHFAFSDHAVHRQHPDLFRRVLEGLASKQLGVNFYALGNLSATDIMAQPDLAGLLKRAGYLQLHFADDRAVPPDESSHKDTVESHAAAAALCQAAGFRGRTDDLAASLCIGRPCEDIAERARLATLLSHHVGSVILWPYQPTPNECPEIELEDQNGKLLPFRHDSGLTYRDYLELLGLAAVLNAKYRTRTFDFMGTGLISQLFQRSIVRRAWDAPDEVKGSVNLPLAVRS